MMRQAIVVVVFFIISFVLIRLHWYPLIPLIGIPMALGYVGFLQFRVVAERDLPKRKYYEQALRRAIWGILGILLVGFILLFIYFGVLAK